MKNKSRIDVSIIIVSYFSKDTISKLIKSIEKNVVSSISFEILIVDNSCSNLEYKELVSSFSKKASVIQAHSNLGFGKANNLASKLAQGRFLFFLNPDTELINDSISPMISFFDTHDKVFIVGGNLFSKDDKPNPSYSMRGKTLFNDLFGNSLLGFLFSHLLRNDNFNHSNHPIEIKGYVSGADLMIRKEVFEKIGGFDQDIFMYAEDAELCFFARKQGGLIYNVPSSKIMHIQGASSISMSDARATYVVDGNFNFYKKVYGEKTASKWLSRMKWSFRKKIFYSLIAFDSCRHSSYSKLVKAIKEKQKYVLSK